MPNCNTIAICNQKGGVGKTTTTVNLGVGLAMQGKKVLLVDADPQGDLTTCLGWKDTDNLPVALPDKMVEVMQDKCKEPMKGILHHKEGVDLIPSNSDLFDFEISLVTAMNREAILRNYLNEVKYNYDYIIIDCSPSLGMMTLNALSAADSVIIPVQAHYLPAKCMTQLMRTITKVKKHINPKLNIYSHFKEANEQEELYESLAQIVEKTETSPETEAPMPTTPPEGDELVMLPEYAELYEQNNDLIGWICIEDTKINYPVMQSVDEPNFYLKHGFDKGYTDYGCPYVGENCDVSKPSDNLIIYGHHMKNGSMFSDLEKFKKKDFWEEHKTFSFNTLYEKQTYEVIAVFKTVVYTDSTSEFKYFQFSDAQTPEQFDEYIAKCKEKALYDTGVSAEYGDKLITLSTCEYSNTNGRLVLVAKRIVD